MMPFKNSYDVKKKPGGFDLESNAKLFSYTIIHGLWKEKKSSLGILLIMCLDFQTNKPSL